MTNEAYIWNKLMDEFGNPNGVAGLMGNLMAESGLNPQNLQNSGNKALKLTDEEYTENVDSGKYSKTKFCYDKFGYGLAQWSSRTRKDALYRFAKNFRGSIGDLDTQVGFLIHELICSYPGVHKTILNAKSVREASDFVLMNYEKPADQSTKVQKKREKMGLDIFDRNYKTHKRFVKVNRVSVNVRSLPEKGASTLGYLYKGDTIEYDGATVNGWHRIKWIDILNNGESSGWVTGKYTSIIEDS